MWLWLWLWWFFFSRLLSHLFELMNYRLWSNLNPFIINRKKCIALEQRRALEEQIETKSRLREEDEARKRQEEEAEQQLMMQEQIAYENEKQAIRDKQLAEEQVRMMNVLSV